MTVTDNVGLIRGMKLVFAAGRPGAGRVELSSGVLPADVISEADTYAKSAYVPRGPWRAPTCREADLLFGGTEAGRLPGDWISVIPTPPEVPKAFAALREASASGCMRQVQALIEGPLGRQALAEAIRWATTLTDPARPRIESSDLVAKIPGGSPTSTTDIRTGERIGLHVDTWYQSPLGERSAVPNRLSINVGDQDHYLLFVNAPLAVMEKLMRERQLLGGQYCDPGFELGRRFLETFPHYPVTKVTVHPGEGWIAPTENMLHDSYAQPLGQIDLQFSCRGYFPAPER